MNDTLYESKNAGLLVKDQLAAEGTVLELAEWLPRKHHQLRITDFPELDVNLLREEFEWASKSAALEEPVEGMLWDQGNWTIAKMKDGAICDSAGCIAGNIAHRRGALTWIEHRDPVMVGLVGEGQNQMSVDQFAKQELGVTTVEQRMLFDAHNSINDLELVASGVCKSRGISF